MPVTYRLYDPADLEQVLPLVNDLFQAEAANPPVPAEAWARLEAGAHVTVVAEEEGRIAGIIPFDLRDLQLRPGVTIRAAFAHCVGVLEGYRGRGVGSGMMAYARAHLGRLCDGLFVYTDGHGGAPYTFYQRAGFVNLHYSRVYKLRPRGGGMPRGVAVSPLDPEDPPGAALAPVYQAAYGAMGGSPPRSAGYWRRALAGIIYVQMPRHFYLVHAGPLSEPSGYALLGVRKHKAGILELAARPELPGLPAELLAGAIAFAGAQGLEELWTEASPDHPALPALHQLGFQPCGREEITVLAGQVIGFEKVWQQLAGETPVPALHLWTPRRQLDLAGRGPSLTLEMLQEATLQRLFLCREDVAEAVRAEAITSPDHPLPLEALQEAFRPVRWVHHALDWV